MSTRTPDPPTLRSLLARRELHLTLTAGEPDGAPSRVDEPVRWVHSSDLADPTPFLSEGMLLLTTGTQFVAQPDDGQAYRDYVARLHRRGVTGLGFGTEVVRAGVPPLLVDACREAGMPLFTVPYDTPFIAVARANADAIAAQAYARQTWALDAQHAIALAALRPDGIGATLRELAKRLDAWVGLFDASGTLVSEHPPTALDAPVRAAVTADAAAVLRRGARAASSVRVGEVAFTLQTLGRGGSLRGVIAIATGGLDRAGRDVVTSVVAMAGLALEQQQRLERARASFRSGLVHALASGDPTLPRRVARELWGGFPAPPVVIAVADAAATARRSAIEWLEVSADAAPNEVFFGTSEHGLVLVVPAARAGVLTEFAQRFDARMGVSEPASYAAFDTALAQALTARDRGGAGLHRFGEIAQLSAGAMLGTASARAVATSILAPLREHADPALFQTLRTWLAQECSNERTALSLGIHRHTVRARLATVSRVLGRDLHRFDERAELWAACAALDARG